MHISELNSPFIPVLLLHSYYLSLSSMIQTTTFHTLRMNELRSVSIEIANTGLRFKKSLNKNVYNSVINLELHSRKWKKLNCEHSECGPRMHCQRLHSLLERLTQMLFESVTPKIIQNKHKQTATIAHEEHICQQLSIDENANVINQIGSKIGTR